MHGFHKTWPKSNEVMVWTDKNLLILYIIWFQGNINCFTCVSIFASLFLYSDKGGIICKMPNRFLFVRLGFELTSDTEVSLAYVNTICWCSSTLMLIWRKFSLQIHYTQN